MTDTTPDFARAVTAIDEHLQRDRKWGRTLQAAAENGTVKQWLADVIDQVALFTAGESVVFAVGTWAEEGNTAEAGVVALTSTRIIELSGATYTGVNAARDYGTVAVWSRSHLECVDLVDIRGPFSAPWRIELSLSFACRRRALPIRSEGADGSSVAPLVAFLPELLANLAGLR